MADVPPRAVTRQKPRQGVAKGPRRQRLEQGTIQADRSGDMEDIERPPVIEQHLMVERADHDTIMQVAQHRLKPAACRSFTGIDHLAATIRLAVQQGADLAHDTNEKSRFP